MPMRTPDEPLPLTEHARTRHRELADLEGLKDFICNYPGRIQRLVRQPFAIAAGENAVLSAADLALFCDRNPALLLRLLNQALMQRKVEARFVALLVMLWHAGTRRLTMANSGAMPPVICRGSEIIKPQVEGVPLGLLPDREYDNLVFQAHPGDLIVVFSDGITDQLNPAGADYGRRRLLELLKKVCAGTPQTVIDAIFADLDRFAASSPAFDDQTLVVLRVK